MQMIDSLLLNGLVSSLHASRNAQLTIKYSILNFYWAARRFSMVSSFQESFRHVLHYSQYSFIC